MSAGTLHIHRQSNYQQKPLGLAAFAHRTQRASLSIGRLFVSLLQKVTLLEGTVARTGGSLCLKNKPGIFGLEDTGLYILVFCQGTWGF